MKNKHTPSLDYSSRWKGGCDDSSFNPYSLNETFRQGWVANVWHKRFYISSLYVLAAVVFFVPVHIFVLVFGV